MENFSNTQQFKDNIITYLMLILICVAFGLVYSAISNWINILGWVFVILTAGLFYFSGGHFVEQGYYRSNKWKGFFVIMIPLYLLIDYLLFQSLTWYDMGSVTAYYFLYTLGFVLKRISKEY